MAVLPFLTQVSMEASDGPSCALLGNYGAFQNWLEAAMPSMGQPWPLLKEATPLLPKPWQGHLMHIDAGETCLQLLNVQIGKLKRHLAANSLVRAVLLASEKSWT